MANGTEVVGALLQQAIAEVRPEKACAAGHNSRRQWNLESERSDAVASRAGGTVFLVIIRK